MAAKISRRASLKAVLSAALLPILPRRLRADATFSRRRPSDAGWPSKAAWQRLNDAVGGNLIPIGDPLAVLKTDPTAAAAKRLMQDLENPYFIGDEPGLTQTLGWVDAWTSQPSVFAVAARNANDIAQAINFARDNDLRLVVKGGGHSYQGTSNAPDSLLIWTRHMNDHRDAYCVRSARLRARRRAATGGHAWRRNQSGCRRTTPSPPKAGDTFRAAVA